MRAIYEQNKINIYNLLINLFQSNQTFTWHKHSIGIEHVPAGRLLSFGVRIKHEPYQQPLLEFAAGAIDIWEPAENAHESNKSTNKEDMRLHFGFVVLFVSSQCLWYGH